MERPKHRRFMFPGLALLAGAALLLGHHLLFPTPEPALAPVATVTTDSVETQRDDIEPPPVATVPARASAKAPSAAANTGGFRGRVIDAATRRPVKEFEVKLVRYYVEEDAHRVDEPITKTFQAETGRFAWNGLTVSTWIASVSARGYQQFDVTGLKIAAGKTTREILVPLLHGYTVRGRVFDKATGTGIADAMVTGRQSNAWGGNYRSAASVKSKDDGSFVLEGVPGGEVTLTAFAQDHAYRELEIAVDEKTPPQEIVLSTGGAIAGIVTTAAGAPLKVQIMISGPYAGNIDTTSDAGRFSLKNMPPGRYEIRTIDAIGSARIEFELGQDERKEDLLLTISAGRSVRGVVRGLQPEQVKKTYVSLGAGSGNFSARLDAQGSYVFTGVPPGRAQLFAYTEGRQLEKKFVVPADQDVALDVVFPPGVRLSGRVTKGGEPATGKNVWMRLADSQPGTGTLYRARTSEDGQYQIEGVVPGEYRLRTDDDISRLITIASDAVVNIDIPSVQLGGRIQEDSGTTPIVGANVYVTGTEPATTRVRSQKQTDNLGQFSLTGIEPGEVLFTVYKPGYEMYREKITYSSPITNKTITLRKGGGAEVRVQRAASREPLRRLMLTEKVPHNEWGIDLWIPLDSEGVGYMPSALAGSTLQVYGSGSKPIVIEEWDGQPLELKL